MSEINKLVRWGRLAACGLALAAGTAAGQGPTERPEMADAMRMEVLGSVVPGTTSEVAGLVGQQSLERIQSNQIWRAYHENGWKALRSGQLDEADTLFRAGLREAQKFPMADPRMATTYNDLAWVFVARGKVDEAAPLAEWALQTRESVRGSFHPEVADSLLLTARIRAEQKKFDEAERLARRGLAIYSRSSFGIGDKHPAYAMDVLGDIQERRGADLEALALYNQALAMRESTLGLDYRFPFLEESDLVGSYRRLEGVLRRLGRTAEADEAQRRGEALESGLGSGLDAPPAAAPVDDPFTTTPMP
jgi:tetratricopeptide (TPR) repeat protein